MGSIRCVLHAACLVAAAVLMTTAVFAVSARPASAKDAWTPEAAATVQREAARAAAKSAADPRERAERLRALHQRETGFGTTHAPYSKPEDDPAAQGERLRLQRLQQQLAHAMRSQKDREAFDKTQPAAKGGVSMTLRTAEGVLDSGGYLYAWDPEDNYIGFVWIDAGGVVMLPGAVGDTLSLVVLPGGPYAPQSVEVTLAAGGDVLLRSARAVPLAIDTDDGSAFAGTLEVTLWPTTGTRGYGTAVTLDTTAGPVQLHLLPDVAYTVEILAPTPYLVEAAGQIEGAADSVPVLLRRGHVFSATLEDPDGLLQGCTASPGGQASHALARDGGAGQRAAKAVFENEAGVPTRMRVAVPHGVPVTVGLSFGAYYDGACLIEDWSLEHVRFRESANERIVLRRRPQPEVELRMLGAGTLAYDYGYMVPVDAPERSQYFSPGNLQYLSLRAGRDYWVTLVTQSSVTAPYTRVTAVAGAFDVTLEVEPLVRVPVRLQAGENEYFSGLLKATRDGRLVAALEIGNDFDFELRVPPGDYRFEITGLAGSRYDAATFESSGVFLRPIVVERSIVADVAQRLDVVLPRPTTGVRFEGVDADLSMHAIALDAGVPIGAMQFWWAALYSDLPQLGLRLRGPGLDDVETTVFPSAARPLVDLSQLAEPPTRLRGTLRDAANTPMPNTSVYFYSEDATFSSYFQTDTAGRFDLPKVRNGLYTFDAPYAGDALPALRDIGDPASNTQQDVRLERATFLAADRNGPALQRIFGSGNNRFRIVFLSEGYVAQRETFTDSNANGVWDGVLFLDLDGDGLWQENEPVQPYGNRSYPAPEQVGSNVSSGNEAFIDLNGDGYPNLDDYAVFIDNTKNYLRALLGTPEIRQGLSFDAYVLFLPSAQAGVDVFSADEQLLMSRDTRFGATYELGRYLLGIDYNAVDAAMAAAMDRRDLQVVLINQPVAVGRANSFILANGGIGNVSPNNTVAGHEFGHNPGGLGDEYNEFSGTYVGWVNPAAGHMTHETDDLSSPWSHLLGDRDDVPIAMPGSPGIGLYAGGYYQTGGVYRPTSNSRMRYNAPHYNAPSKEKMARELCLRSVPEPVATSLPPTPPGRIFASEFEPAYKAVPLPCAS